MVIDDDGILGLGFALFQDGNTIVVGDDVLLVSVAAFLELDVFAYSTCDERERDE